MPLAMYYSLTGFGIARQLLAQMQRAGNGAAAGPYVSYSPSAHY